MIGTKLVEVPYFLNQIKDNNTHNYNENDDV